MCVRWSITAPPHFDCALSQLDAASAERDSHLRELTKSQQALFEAHQHVKQMEFRCNELEAECKVQREAATDAQTHVYSKLHCPQIDQLLMSLKEIGDSEIV
jgi:hypothetical protein